MEILGLDPGTYYTGFSVFNPQHIYLNNKGLIDYGVIHISNNTELSNRLGIIREELIKIIDRHEINAVCLESYYFHTNTAQGKYILFAQGVILETIGHYPGIKHYFLMPSEVKSCVTGYGKSNKTQVMENIELFYGKVVDKTKFPDINKFDDIYDAIAIGHTFIYKKLPSLKRLKEL